MLRPALLLLLLGGCSTVADRRGDPPVFQQLTEAPLAQVQGCLSSSLEKQNARFLPRANGGSFTTTVGLYQSWTPWVVDVEDLGQQRRVTLYAADSLSGPDRSMIATVAACL